MDDKPDASGRTAYRKSLEQNAGTPSHRRPAPLSPAKRAALARLYDLALQKTAPAPELSLSTEKPL